MITNTDERVEAKERQPRKIIDRSSHRQTRRKKVSANAPAIVPTWEEKEAVQGSVKPAVQFPSHNPFIFRSGWRVHSLEEFVRACGHSPYDATYHFERGDFERWFAYIGRDDLTRLVHDIRSEVSHPSRLVPVLCSTIVGNLSDRTSRYHSKPSPYYFTNCLMANDNKPFALNLAGLMDLCQSYPDAALHHLRFINSGIMMWSSNLDHNERKILENALIECERIRDRTRIAQEGLDDFCR